ncbi:MAG: phosphopantothenoylcysteine decarboxylase, partial [Chloroflexia bacterium]
EGRLVSPETIVGAVRWRLGRGRVLAGKKVVVTAGGAREHLDPVRYIGNGSSGRMGFALAQAAIDEGADTTLVSANVELPPPWGASVLRAVSAADVLRSTHEACADADALLMAAAVADYTPASPSTSKLKKHGGELTLQLAETEDVLASLRRDGLVKVGFAAETDNLLETARVKLARKGLDLIVANDAAATIGAAEADVAIIGADGVLEQTGLVPKEAAAERVVAALVRILASREPAAEEYWAIMYGRCTASTGGAGFRRIIRFVLSATPVERRWGVDYDADDTGRRTTDAGARRDGGTRR